MSLQQTADDIFFEPLTIDEFSERFPTAKPEENLMVFHKGLNHASWANMQQLIKQGILDLKNYKPTPDEIDDVQRCTTCYYENMVMKSHNHKHKRAERRLFRNHSDVMGPLDMPNGKHYVATLIDDYSGFTYVIWASMKNVIPEIMRVLRHWNTLFPHEKIAIFCADNGNELPSQSDLDELGIKREVIPNYSPEMNGLSERTNRTIMHHVRKAIAGHNQNIYVLLEYLVKYAAHMKNRTPTMRNKDSKTPFELFRGTAPVFDSVQAFGTDVFVKFTAPAELKRYGMSTQKYRSHSILGTLIGFGDDSNTYQILLSTPKTKIVLTNNVRFLTTHAALDRYIAYAARIGYDNLKRNAAKMNAEYAKIFKDNFDPEIHDLGPFQTRDKTLINLNFERTKQAVANEIAPSSHGDQTMNVPPSAGGPPLFPRCNLRSPTSSNAN